MFPAAEQRGQLELRHWPEGNDLSKSRGDLITDAMRTHPLVILGGVLQVNPFFIPPDQFLRELRERRSTGPRASGPTSRE
jgi:hypothetical protein